MGGAARALCPPLARPGGACRAGGRYASFRPSAFPGQATKRVSLASFCPCGAWPPVPLRFVLARLHWARSVRRPGALAPARLFPAVPVGASSWGGGVGRAPAPLSGGGGGPSPLPRGMGAGAPAACGPVEGVGGGGSRRGLPAPPLGGGPQFPILAPLVSSAHSPPACACSRGREAAPGWGEMRGGPWTAPPGAPADLNSPSDLPEWAVVMGGSWGAQPPYCSGAPPCAAPRLGPRIAPARCCRLACRPRPPREQAVGGAGARGAQVQPHPPPPPPASRSLLGEGGHPLGSGAAEDRSCGPQARGGGRGEGCGAAAPPPPPPRRASACHQLSPVCPPGAYSCRGGFRAAAGVRRGPVGRQCVSAAGGGGGGGSPPALVRAPGFLG